MKIIVRSEELKLFFEEYREKCMLTDDDNPLPPANLSKDPLIQEFLDEILSLILYDLINSDSADDIWMIDDYAEENAFGMSEVQVHGICKLLTKAIDFAMGLGHLTLDTLDTLAIEAKGENGSLIITVGEADGNN